MVKQNVISNQEVETLKNAIIKFMMSEYGQTKDEAVLKIGDMYLDNIIPIAYTTYGDNEEFEIEVSFNFDRMELRTSVIGESIIAREYKKFQDIYEAMDTFENCSFDSMVRLNDLDIDQLLIIEQR